MSSSATRAAVVRRAQQPSGYPQPFPLARATAIVRRTRKVLLAILTGDKSRCLSAVALAPIEQDSALSLLAEMRKTGTKTVLVSLLDGAVCLGATSLLPLI